MRSGGTSQPFPCSGIGVTFVSVLIVLWASNPLHELPSLLYYLGAQRSVVKGKKKKKSPEIKVKPLQENVISR